MSIFFKKTFFIVGLFSFFFVQLAVADTITDRIDLAKRKYLEGKFKEAISELEFAAGLIKQKKAEEIKMLLPDPLSGWKAQEAKSGAAPLFLGGGSSASRKYYNDNGATVEISIISDAPLLSSLLMMLANPNFIGAGNKITMVKGEKAIEEWDDVQKSGKLTIVLGEKVLVIVEGSNLANKEILYKFAELLNFEKIKKLTGG